jgi:predicted RNase H-like nuclease (RuvC/YqgF family)
MFDWFKFGIIASIFTALVGGHYYLQGNAVDAAVKKVEDKYKLQLQISEQKAITSTAKLYKETIDDLNTKNEKLNNLNTEYERAIVSLRNRKARPSEPVHTTVTEIRETCTGRELFKEDAEFLTREASRADKVVVQRDFYYQRYEEARIMLETLKESNGKAIP